MARIAVSEPLMTPVNSRVGAIISYQHGVVRLLGFGVYEGDFLPPGVPFANPRIRLDNGEIVWGIECWWAAEHLIQARLKTATAIVMCKIMRDDIGQYEDCLDIQ